MALKSLKDHLARRGSEYLTAKSTEHLPERYRCQGCGAEVDGELHPCPYNEDVHGDDEPTCNCCADCANTCARDI